jgi:cell division protein FtsN
VVITNIFISFLTAKYHHGLFFQYKESPPGPDSFFVIIGSFRNYENAINYQKTVNNLGFNSILLRNEKGLYRVSVMSTNHISEAREEIRRIRLNYPKHNDTWLLIQDK